MLPYLEQKFIILSQIIDTQNSQSNTSLEISPNLLNLTINT
jgi:hypothetical protein